MTLESVNGAVQVRGDALAARVSAMPPSAIPAATPAPRAAEVTEGETTIRTCRVAVLLGSTQTDMDLPADVPLGTLMFEIIKVLGSSLHEQGKDVSIFRAKTAGRWTLGYVGVPPMPYNKSLSEMGVTDGTMLVLQRAQAAEQYRPLVDDVLDAAAGLITARNRLWDDALARVMGAVILVIGCLSASVLVLGFSVSHRSTWVVPVVALVAAMAAVVGAGLAGDRYNAPSVSTGLIVGAYPLAAAGGASIVSPGWGPYNLVLCAGAMIFVAVVSAAVFNRANTLAASVITVSAIALTVALARAFWSVGYVALGAGTVLVAMLTMVLGPKLALLMARVPLPAVPTLGLGFNEPDKSPKFIVAGAPGASQYKAPGAEEFEQRVESGDEYLTGIVLGAVLCLIGGTALAAEPGHSRYWLAFTLSALVAVSILRRARNVADRIQAVAQLAGGSIIVVATVVRLAVFDGRLWVALTVLAFVLVVAVGAAIAGVVLPGLSFNALQRRRGELLEMFVVAMIYPLCFWIMDIYQLLRDLK